MALLELIWDGLVFLLFKLEQAYEIVSLSYQLTNTYDGFFSVFMTNFTWFLTLKITLCLTMLILIRGGVPRYRYDFLTKLGWVKFLGYLITIFLTLLVLLLIW